MAVSALENENLFFVSHFSEKGTYFWSKSNYFLEAFFLKKGFFDYAHSPIFYTSDSLWYQNIYHISRVNIAKKFIFQKKLIEASFSYSKLLCKSGENWPENQYDYMEVNID